MKQLARGDGVHLTQLSHYYIGKFVSDGRSYGDFALLACSKGLEPAAVEQLVGTIPFGSSSNARIESLKDGYALLQARNGQFVLIHMRPSPFLNRGSVIPEYHCVLLPPPDAGWSQFAFSDLIRLFDGVPWPIFAQLQTDLEALNVTITPQTSGKEEPHSRADEARAHPTLQDGAIIANLLARIVEEKSVSVVRAPEDVGLCLRVVDTLAELLPAPFFAPLTFATQVMDGKHCTAALKFLFPSNITIEEHEDVLDWQHVPHLDASHPYTAFVAHCLKKGLRLPSSNDAGAVYRALSAKSGAQPTDLAALYGVYLWMSQADIGAEHIPPHIVELALKHRTRFPIEAQARMLEVIGDRALALRDERQLHALFTILCEWDGQKLRAFLQRRAHGEQGEFLYFCMQRWGIAQHLPDAAAVELWTALVVGQLRYLVSEGTSGRVTRFLVEALHRPSLEHPADAWATSWITPLFHSLVPLAESGAEIATELFVLAALRCVEQDYSLLAHLAGDAGLSSHMPRPYATCLKLLTEQTPKKAFVRGILNVYEALYAYEHTADAIFVGLVIAAAALENAPLYPAPVWDTLYRALERSPFLGDYTYALVARCCTGISLPRMPQEILVSLLRLSVRFFADRPFEGDLLDACLSDVFAAPDWDQLAHQLVELISACADADDLRQRCNERLFTFCLASTLEQVITLGDQLAALHLEHELETCTAAKALIALGAANPSQFLKNITTALELIRTLDAVNSRTDALDWHSLGNWIGFWWRRSALQDQSMDSLVQPIRDLAARLGDERRNDGIFRFSRGRAEATSVQPHARAELLHRIGDVLKKA